MILADQASMIAFSRPTFRQERRPTHFGATVFSPKTGMLRRPGKNLRHDVNGLAIFFARHHPRESRQADNRAIIGWEPGSRTGILNGLQLGFR